MHEVEIVLRDDRGVGIHEYLPILPGRADALFALVRAGAGLEIQRVTEVLDPPENVRDRPRCPVIQVGVRANVRTPIARHTLRPDHRPDFFRAVPGVKIVHNIPEDHHFVIRPRSIDVIIHRDIPHAKIGKYHFDILTRH